jgi:hypothetical protein
VRLNNRGANGVGACDALTDMQTLIDRVVPYMSPRLRPTLTYQQPGSESVRSMVLRGADWPVAWSNPKYPSLPLQWVCPSGEIYSGDADDTICDLISPAASVEAGRTYDLVFDRVYPPSAPVGGRIITNVGNAAAHWVITIFGAVTNPFATINGRQLIFNRNGGLVVNAGQSVVIDSRERTVLFNGDPASSRYDRTNFDQWTWDQMRLAPGENTIVFGGTALGGTAAMQICYRPTWLA